MSQPRTKLHPKIREALEACGLPWEVTPGRRHQHVRIAGRLAAVIPWNGGPDRTKFGNLNVIAQIRRIAKEINNGSGQ